jgi:hypothetical protein
MSSSIGELRRWIEMADGDIASLGQAIRQLKASEDEHIFHIRRMERGEPKPGARRREEDFDPEMMDKAVKDIRANIRKHKNKINVLEKKKVDWGLELGRILTGGSKN